MRMQQTVQVTVDALMTVLLLVLFAAPWTGVLHHEWTGVMIFALFALHNALHSRWYAGLPHGPYHARRTAWTAVNMLLLAAMLLTAYSGVMISRHAFAFLRLDGSLTWRKIHLAAAYWGLVLTGLHAGLHVPLFTGALKKRIPAPVLNCAALLLGVAGLYACRSLRLWHKLLFLETFSASAPSAVVCILQHLAVVGLFALIACRLINAPSRSEKFLD